jgi:hypothetical protein
MSITNKRVRISENPEAKFKELLKLFVLNLDAHTIKAQSLFKRFNNRETYIHRTVIEKLEK